MLDAVGEQFEQRRRTVGVVRYGGVGPHVAVLGEQGQHFGVGGVFGDGRTSGVGACG